MAAREDLSAFGTALEEPSGADEQVWPTGALIPAPASRTPSAPPSRPSFVQNALGALSSAIVTPAHAAETALPDLSSYGTPAASQGALPDLSGFGSPVNSAPAPVSAKEPSGQDDLGGLITKAAMGLGLGGNAKVASDLAQNGDQDSWILSQKKAIENGLMGFAQWAGGALQQAGEATPETNLSANLRPGEFDALASAGQPVPRDEVPADQLAKVNAPFVKPGKHTYNTKLSPQNETDFRAWLAQNNVPFDANAPVTDYDMRGFWKALRDGNPRATAAVDPNDNRLHYPDYWKTPLHRTFSNESQWATSGAPRWNDQDQLIGKGGVVLFDDRQEGGRPLSATQQMAADAQNSVNIPGTPAHIGKKIYDSAAADIKANAPKVPPESVKNYAYMATQAFIQMLPSIALGVAAKSSVPALGGMYLQQSAQQYGQARDESGRTPEQATRDATFYGLAETLPEQIPVGILMRPGKKFLPKLFKMAGAEGLQEMFTQALESAYDKATISPDMTWGQAWQQIKAAGIVGAAVGSGLHVATHPFINEHEAPAPGPLAAAAAATHLGANVEINGQPAQTAPEAPPAPPSGPPASPQPPEPTTAAQAAGNAADGPPIQRPSSAEDVSHETPAATYTPVHDPETWAQIGWEDADGKVLPLDAPGAPGNGGVSLVEPGGKAENPPGGSNKPTPPSTAPVGEEITPEKPQPVEGTAEPTPPAAETAGKEITPEQAAEALKTKIDPATGQKPKGNAALRKMRARMSAIVQNGDAANVDKPTLTDSGAQVPTSNPVEKSNEVPPATDQPSDNIGQLPEPAAKDSAVEVPEGFEVDPAASVAPKLQSQKGGKFTAVARRAEPFSSERGYGDTPADAQRDALRRIKAIKPADTAEPVAASSPNIAPAGDVKLAGKVAEHLDTNGKPLTQKSLIAMADDAYGGTVGKGTYDPRRAYDAMELGMNRHIVENPKRYDPTVDAPAAQKVAEDLRTKENMLPLQSRRTGDTDAFQQFSTPPAYAYAASWAANMHPGDVVLEPSAGNGGLAAFAKNAGAKVVANELSEGRRQNLDALPLDRVTGEDAEQIDNILPDDVKPSVVLMNPPFSNAAGRGGVKDSNITGRHIDQALKRLAPGGRLVAITGGNFVEGNSRNRPFFTRWGKEHNIRASVEVSGQVFKRYGTTYPTRVIIIDKTAPDGHAPITGTVDTAEELIDRLKGIRDDRPQSNGTLGKGSKADQERLANSKPSAGERASEGTTAEGEKDAGPGDALHPATGGDGAERSEGDVEATPPGGDEGSTRRPPGGKAAGRDGVVSAGGRGARSGGRSTGGGDTGGEPTGEPDGGEPAGLPAAGPEGPAGLEYSGKRRKQVADELGDGVYQTYRPQRLEIPGAQPHPAELVQSAAMASVEPPEPTYKPKLDRKIITDGLLSEAQLEPVVYAGQAHEKMLGDGETRRGYFIGDGTGVGKGREISGIIMDNLHQGRKKAVWVSEKWPLLGDAKRDWSGIGGDAKRILNGKAVKATEAIAHPEGIFFTTYDTLKGKPKAGAKGTTRVEQLVNWLGKDFDGVVAFDEAHNMANADTRKGSRGKTLPSAKALAGVELQKQLPKARIVYVSATGATEVANLGYAERLGLWGQGTSFPTKANFITQIEQGGTSAMELVARDIKQMGSYTARGLSFNGVKYDRLEHKLTDNQRAMYDELAGAWQKVLQNINKALEVTGGNKDGRTKAAAYSAFWGSHQRFFNQILTSMEMPTVLDRVAKDLEEGGAPVLQLVNTNEAAQERALANMGDEGSLEELDLTPRDQLMQMIEHSFPVAAMETYVDENGTVRARPVVDSKGNFIQDKAAVEIRDRLLDDLASIRVPDGPLEYLLNRFGHDKVAEVTGRTRRVIEKNGKRVIERRSASANTAEADAFMSGKKKILVFSQAGGTGRSYHADKGAKNQGQRQHYLLQPGWSAAPAIQGFGRTHRSNQTSKPFYRLATTDVVGQKRFISSIARRLDQLGALTKGERRSGGQGFFGEKDNLESDYAADAVTRLVKNIVGQDADVQARGLTPDVLTEQMGLSGLVDERTGSLNVSKIPTVPQFLNRLLSLKLDMQSKVFDAFDHMFEQNLNAARADGTLDVGVEQLRADHIKQVHEEVVHTDAESGAETKYTALETKTRIKPRQWKDIEPGKRLEGFGPQIKFVARGRNGKTYAFAETRERTDERGDIVPQYLRISPLTQGVTDARVADNPDKYEVLDGEDAKAAWQAELKKVPEFSTRTEHMITGAILPIWDRLPKGHVKVYRATTDSGEQYLGRVIPEGQLQETLRNLGATARKIEITPTEAFEKVIGNGQVITLANGWRLSKRTVAGEARMRLTGPDPYQARNVMEQQGAQFERIAYEGHFFIPDNERGRAFLEKQFKQSPPVSVGEDDGRLAETSNPFDERKPFGKFDPAPPAGEFRSLTDEVDRALKPDPRISDLRDYLLARGRATGTESLVMRDARTGEVLHAGTIGAASTVDITPEMTATMAAPEADVVVHHNHPSGRSLSDADIRAFRHVGLKAIFAYGHDGSWFGARLTDPARASIKEEKYPLGRDIKLGALVKSAEDVVQVAFRKLVSRTAITTEQANGYWAHMVNTALDRAGVIHYFSSMALPEELKPHADAILRKAADNAAKQADELQVGRDQRADVSVGQTQPVRLEEGADELLGGTRQAGEPAGGREGPAPDQGALGRSQLGEEKDPFSDREEARRKRPGVITRALGKPMEDFGRRVSEAADRLFPETVKEGRRAVQMAIAPMARGTPYARAAAKDFANANREARYIGGRQVDYLGKNFTHDELQRMWETADEQSVAMQQGRPTAGMGLDTLTKKERAVVEAYQRESNAALEQAIAAGLYKGEGLPSYVPRMVVAMGVDGKYGRMSDGGGNGPHGLNAIGRNLRTTSANLRHRKYLTAEETEAAAQALNAGAVVVKDIRTLPIATMRLKQAIAGRTLINKIRDMGRDSGEMTVSEGSQPETSSTGHKWFTLDHPAFKTYRPMLVKNAETKKFEVLTDKNGNELFERVPLYVRDDFEGPLRAVLSTDSGAIYRAAMDLKGKMMSVIMYSPAMHNMVIWGKAVPAAPLKLLKPLWRDADGKWHVSIELYGRGRAAKNDPAEMKEALQNGLDPIGHRFYNQDLSSLMEEPDIKPGRSWTAQAVAAIPGLFDKSTGDAIKRKIDHWGDIWHNKLLWDLVGDLQMGLYTDIRDKAVRAGVDRDSAGKLAAHFANRYGGVLPLESMSKIARQAANMLMFSRSFTLTNAGAYKDLVKGLPGDVQAQILRDKGLDTLNTVQGMARRKAISLLLMDIFLSYAGLYLAQHALAFINGIPFHPPGQNEPDRERRFLIGYQKDGRAIYGRLPTGKVGEELQDWIASPADLAKRKLSPYGRIVFGVLSNDKGFGRKIYDPYDETVMGYAKNIGRIASYAAEAVAPLEPFEAMSDISRGKGDLETNIEKLLLPMIGITVSRGAPGGPAVGALYHSKDVHDFAVQEAMPDIRDRISDGDVQGAAEIMTRLGLPRWRQLFIIRTTQNPKSRLSRHQLMEFMRQASPEDKAEMQRFIDEQSSLPEQHSELTPPASLGEAIGSPQKLRQFADSGQTWSRTEAIKAAEASGLPATANLLRNAREPATPAVLDRIAQEAG